MASTCILYANVVSSGGTTNDACFQGLVSTLSYLVTSKKKKYQVDGNLSSSSISIVSSTSLYTCSQWHCNFSFQVVLSSVNFPSTCSSFMGLLFGVLFPSIRLHCTACLDRAYLACLFSENFSFNRSFAPCCSFLAFGHLIWMCLFGVMSHGFCGTVDRVGRLRNLFLNFNQALTQLRFPEGSSCLCAQTTVTKQGGGRPQHTTPRATRPTQRSAGESVTHNALHGSRRRATCRLLLRFRVRLCGDGALCCADTSIQPPDGVLPLRLGGSLGCLRGLPHHGHRGITASNCAQSSVQVELA